MDEAAEKEVQQLRSFPAADFLRKLVSGDDFAGKFEDQNDEMEEIELSLGLSLNGRFGVDPRANKLKRSSSIPEFMKEEDGGGLISAAAAPLVRTYSLPTETEEELRKRKELQSLRRLEAKRKRSEKQRNARVSRDGEQCVKVLNEFSAMRMPSSVCSPTNGGKNSPEAKSTTTSTHSSPESEQKPAVSPNNLTGVTPENRSGSKSGVEKNGAREIARNMLEDMPCVSTRGQGPNGKRVEGFLYRFRKGEEVRIVCVCHGRFLTPAEFVKHAGGGDVAHPLKHIVVSPSFM